MTRVRAASVALLLLLGLLSSPAHAATAIFAIAIGYNGRPAAPNAIYAPDLRFADDDALAVHEFARRVARRSVLLTIPDKLTQARYASSQEARPPTLAELRRALAEFRAAIQRASQSGEDVAIWFFYSGHGWLGDDRRGNLALADGALSQRTLYDEVLPALPGRTIHLMIDACHAEAMIRARDVTAETVDISASDAAIASLRNRLSQSPNVGVLMASASNTQAHEWDDYQTGVFTHELLSGLRGGADVNGDGRIEYSEMSAFLAAANRGVTDPRARLTTLVVAPRLYPRAAIVDIRGASDVAFLQGRAHHLGHFQIDDLQGNRLLDLKAEPDFAVNLALPAGEPLLLSNERGETKFVAPAERAVSMETLTLTPPSLRRRSASVESMRRGLFAAEFGPSYYRGYVDSSGPNLVPVDLTPRGALVASPATPSAAGSQRSAAWASVVLGGLSLTASCVFAVLTARAYNDFQQRTLERQSFDARDRYQRYGWAALGTGALGALALGVGYWLWDAPVADRRSGP